MLKRTKLQRWAKATICNVFDHFMRFDTSNVAGPSHCILCGHKEHGIKWPRS